MRGSLTNKRFGTSANASIGSWFGQFANTIARVSGKPTTFLLAIAIVVTWGLTGPIFQYSDTWQLIINTGTTIITFLMVFLIQNTQNRDTLALQLKLDELILATKNARNELVAVEERCEDELEERHQEERNRAQSSVS